MIHRIFYILRFSPYYKQGLGSGTFYPLDSDPDLLNKDPPDKEIK